MMTSSPGRTPTDRRARCKATVQFATAQAWAAPTAVANSCSKAATCGPWVSQPDRIVVLAAFTSAVPTNGFAIGII